MTFRRAFLLTLYLAFSIAMPLHHAIEHRTTAGAGGHHDHHGHAHHGHPASTFCAHDDDEEQIPHDDREPSHEQCVVCQLVKSLHVSLPLPEPSIFIETRASAAVVASDSPVLSSDFRINKIRGPPHIASL